MYSEFFKLKSNPFGETPDTRFFFKANSHVTALDQVLNAIRASRGFTLVCGEVGTGKTVLSRVLLNFLQSRLPTALILNPMTNHQDLLRSVREEFKLPAPMVDSVKSEYDQIAKFLIETASEKKRAVLIVDEAQRLSFEGLEAIRLLSNLETEDRKLLQIVMIGQPEMKSRLEEFELRQLSQRISIRLDIEPLSVKEVEEYIKHRIDIVGGTNFVRFEQDACELIEEETNGIPRLINFLCERALAEAERSKTRLITEDDILDLLEQREEKPFWHNLLSFGRGAEP